jgi:hypothetical protein
LRVHPPSDRGFCHHITASHEAASPGRPGVAASAALHRRRSLGEDLHMKTLWAFLLGVLLTALFLFGIETGVAQDPVKAHPEMFKVLLENERVRVIDDLVPAGAKVSMHSHPEYVVYPLSSYRMKFIFPDGSSRIVDIQEGTARYVPGMIHAEENVGTTDAHALLVEIKPPK